MKGLSRIYFVLVLSMLRNRSLFSVLVFSCLLKWWVAALRLQVIRFSFSLNGGNDSSLHPLRFIFSFMKWASADFIRLKFLTGSGSKRGLSHQVWTHWTPLGRTSQLSYQLFSNQWINEAVYVLTKHFSFLLLAREHHAVFLLWCSSEMMC